MRIKINKEEVFSFIKKREKLLVFASGFLLIPLLLLVINFISFLFKPKSITTMENNVLSDSQINTSLPTDIKTLGILLVGYGGAGHQGGFLADAIQLLYLDFENKKAALISIPRDLWVSLPTGGEAKINTALTTNRQGMDLIVSGANNLKKIISDITNLKINNFIAVDFVGFQRTIGIGLKGIEVQVGETLDDPWYPVTGEELNTCGLTPKEVASLSAKYSGFELERQFPCRYKHLYFEKGAAHMEGGDALEYVRSRHGSGEGDISRGRRQQEVLKAISNKLFSINTLDDIPTIYESLVKYVSTDLDLESVKYLKPLLLSLKDIKVKTINLSTTNVLTSSSSNSGQAILIPKEGIGRWNNVEKYISQEINK